MKRYQFVWWGWREIERGWGFWRPDPDDGFNYIYRWSLTIGPLEIRRWV